MKKTKTAISLLLVLILFVFSSVPSAFADDEWRNRVTGFTLNTVQNYYPGYTRAIQRFLWLYSTSTHNSIYDGGGIDGMFGTKTKDAVISFQNSVGIGNDGEVGPITWGKMYDVMQKSWSGSKKMFSCSNVTSVGSQYVMEAKQSQYNSYWWFYSYTENGVVYTYNNQEESFHHCL